MAADPAPKKRSRSISELQRDAPGIVKEVTKHGEVEITRYGQTAAYLMSEEDRRRLRDTERALNRAIWARDLKRAMEDWRSGNVVPWEEVEAELIRRFET